MPMPVDLSNQEVSKAIISKLWELGYLDPDSLLSIMSKKEHKQSAPCVTGTVDGEEKGKEREKLGEGKDEGEPNNEDTEPVTVEQFLKHLAKDMDFSGLLMDPKKCEEIRRILMSCPSEFNFLSLPEEVKALIVSELSHTEKVRLKGVCKYLKALVEDKSTWSKELVDLYQQMYGEKPWKVNWTKEEIEFCEQQYGKSPWKLTQIPMLRVQASELVAYIPYARVIWDLKIEGAQDSTPTLLKSFPNLTLLDLSYSSHIMDHGLRCLADNCKKLTYLDLSYTEVSDIAIEALIKNCPNLTTLNLDNTEVTDHTIVEMAKNCPHLTYLDLSHTHITGNSLEYLPKLENLTTVSLNNACATDTGLRYLVDNCPKLTTLYMCMELDSDITCAGLRYLADNCPTLTTLKLSVPNIDNVLQYLPKNLITLDLSNFTDLSDMIFSTYPRALLH